MTIPQNPYLTGWGPKDFEVTIQICQIGTCFKALYALVFMVISHFLDISYRPNIVI